jgi:hypothetical protein
VLRDPELVELLSDEPELLALADAYEATQRRYWNDRGTRRWFRPAVAVAVVAAIAIPAAAFADQIGNLIGLYNQGKPVPASAFPNPWAAALVRDPGFGKWRGATGRAGSGDHVLRGEERRWQLLRWHRFCAHVQRGKAKSPLRGWCRTRRSARLVSGLRVDVSSKLRHRSGTRRLEFEQGGLTCVA